MLMAVTILSALYDRQRTGKGRRLQEHWTRLSKLIGREDLLGDERYATMDARIQNQVEVNEIVSEWTRQHTKQEAMQLVSGVGVPAGAVFDTAEIQNDPNFEERGILQTIHHPMHGDFKMPAWPLRVDGAPPRLVTSPMLGEHNEQVLREWLGISVAEVEALPQEGVL
jgi:formyl-CoA transferase